MTNKKLPNILIIDIETAPILGYVWSLWENNLGLNQIESDWHLLSFSAKWFTDASGRTFGPHKKIIYADQRNEKDVSNDKKLLVKIWELLNQADILLTQNGVSFDDKKIKARFLMHGMNPPSPYRHIDTKKIVSRQFALTSNKLEYMTDKLCTKYKKQKNAGFSMWTRCLKGELKAYREMERYNKYDILSLEELYHKLQPWDNTVNFSVYAEDGKILCNCGNDELQKRGYAYTNVGKFQRFQCTKCSKWHTGKQNLTASTIRKHYLK